MPRIPGIANIEGSAYSGAVQAYVGKLALVANFGLLVGCLFVGGQFFGCGPKVPNYDYAQEPDPRRNEYVVGVDDGLNINVWKNEQLSTSVIVRPDGTVTMPLVGDLVARGKTPSQLRTEICKRLTEYVKLDCSEITVAVTGVNSYRFSVSGEVARPGTVQSRQYLTVAEAIAEAGGFTRFAERNEMVLTRRDKDGNIRRIPIAYDFIEDGSHLEMNLVMLAGDSLHVP